VRIDKCRSARDGKREYERTQERKEQAIERANADEQERVCEEKDWREAEGKLQDMQAHQYDEKNSPITLQCFSLCQ